MYILLQNVSAQVLIQMQNMSKQSLIIKSFFTRQIYQGPSSTKPLKFSDSSPAGYWNFKTFIWKLSCSVPIFFTGLLNCFSEPSWQLQKC